MSLNIFEPMHPYTKLEAKAILKEISDMFDNCGIDGDYSDLVDILEASGEFLTIEESDEFDLARDYYASLYRRRF